MKEIKTTGAFKAGIFYLIAELVTRGISFFMTPVFTRLLPDEVYAEAKVFEAWVYLFAPVISLSVYQSVARAKFDFKNSYYKYIASMVGFMISVVAVIGVGGYFFNDILSRVLGFSSDLLLLLLIYCLSYNVIQCIQMGERQLLHYQNNILLTVLAVVPSVILSVIFIISSKDHVDSSQLLKIRLYSFCIPVILLGVFVGICALIRGKSFFNSEYWNYGLRYSVPMIFFALSTQVLYQSDKIMVKKFCGVNATALLALATTIGYIMDILVHAIDNAWRPWLYERLYVSDYVAIEKVWFSLLRVVCIISSCIVLLAPELILFLGGKDYEEAVWLIGPIVCGSIANFIMIGYIAIVQYCKENKISGYISLVVAFSNIILNYIFIHAISYQATVYTTMFCYLISGIANCLLVVKKYKLKVFNPNKTFFFWGKVSLISLFLMTTYHIPGFIRMGVVVGIIIYMSFEYKEFIINSIRGIQNK